MKHHLCWLRNYWENGALTGVNNLTMHAETRDPADRAPARGIGRLAINDESDHVLPSFNCRISVSDRSLDLPGKSGGIF